MDIPQFAYPFPVNGHLDYFYFLAVKNSAAGNIHEQVFVWACVYFLLQRDLSGISGLCGQFMFNFLRNYQNGCTILHFTVSAWGICFFSSLPFWLYPFWWVWSDVTVDLIWIRFHVLLIIHVSFDEMCIQIVFCSYEKLELSSYWFVKVVVFLQAGRGVCYGLRNLSSLTSDWIQALAMKVWSSNHRTTLWNSLICVSGVKIIKIFTPVFSSKSFIVLALIFRPVIHWVDFLMCGFNVRV